MKKLLVVAIALSLAATTAFSAQFAPTLLKLSADPVIQYDFDGSNLTIPVVVSGTSAGIVFSVFTRGKANSIVGILNGYLGWHYVNNGRHLHVFLAREECRCRRDDRHMERKGQDGTVVPAGDYTYYLGLSTTRETRRSP
jgi:hypothetical protein